MYGLNKGLLTQERSLLTENTQLKLKITEIINKIKYDVSSEVNHEVKSGNERAQMKTSSKQKKMRLGTPGQNNLKKDGDKIAIKSKLLESPNINQHIPFCINKVEVGKLAPATTELLKSNEIKIKQSVRPMSSNNDCDSANLENHLNKYKINYEIQNNKPVVKHLSKELLNAQSNVDYLRSKVSAYNQINSLEAKRREVEEKNKLVVSLLNENMYYDGIIQDLQSKIQDRNLEAELIKVKEQAKQLKLDNTNMRSTNKEQEKEIQSLRQKLNQVSESSQLITEQIEELKNSDVKKHALQVVEQLTKVEQDLKKEYAIKKAETEAIEKKNKKELGLISQNINHLQSLVLKQEKEIKQYYKILKDEKQKLSEAKKIKSTNVGNKGSYNQPNDNTTLIQLPNTDEKRKLDFMTLTDEDANQLTEELKAMKKVSDMHNHNKEILNDQEKNTHMRSQTPIIKLNGNNTVKLNRSLENNNDTGCDDLLKRSLYRVDEIKQISKTFH